MKNRVGVVIVFSLIGIAIAYYFVIFLPQENHRLMVECRSLGEKIEQAMNSPSSSHLPMKPEYYYNSKLKKCFYCGGYTADGLTAQFIVNAYTNEEIAFLVENPRIGLSNQEVLEKRVYFYNKKQQLFNKKLGFNVP